MGACYHMKYRIQKDGNGEFLADFRFKWWPFWFKASRYKDKTKEEAKETIDCKKKRVKTEANEKKKTTIWEGE